MSMLPKNGVYWDMIHLEKKMQKKANRCRNCNYMQNGWCNKYNAWCSSCLGCKRRNGIEGQKGGQSYDSK